MVDHMQFFMDECNRHLEDEVEAREKELSSMLLAERIAQLVRLRLQMQIPFLSKWPQALSIQVLIFYHVCCLQWYPFRAKLNFNFSLYLHSFCYALCFKPSFFVTLLHFNLLRSSACRRIP